MKVMPKVPFNLSSTSSLRNLKKIGERQIKITKIRKPKKERILPVAYAKEKAIWRKIVGLKANHNVEFARNSATSRSLVA